MKKLIFISLLMLSVVMLKAQSNDSIKITVSKYQYCEISGNEPFMGKMKISIDYGTSEEKTDYKSMIAALNDMSAKGWELVTAYTNAKNNGNNTTFYYVLRKRVE